MAVAALDPPPTSVTISSTSPGARDLSACEPRPTRSRLTSTATNSGFSCKWTRSWATVIGAGTSRRWPLSVISKVAPRANDRPVVIQGTGAFAQASRDIRKTDRLPKSLEK